MQTRELVRNFKVGSWGHSAQAQHFGAAAGDVPAADLIKLLDVLTSKANSNEPPAALKNRIQAFTHLVDRLPDPALFQPFVKAMRSNAPPLVRQMLASLLPKVNHIPHHQDLIVLLKDKDPALRKITAAVLGQIGGKTTFEVLRQFIREYNFQGRIEAIDVLMPIAGHYAIPALADVIKHGSSNEKVYALRFLGDPRYIGKDLPGALVAIREAIQDKDKRVASTAIAAFSALAPEDDWFEVIGPMLDSPNLQLVRAAVDGLKRFRSLRAVGALERAFRTGPNVIRMSVLETAEQVADESILPLLVEGINHRHMTIRNKSAEVITQLSMAGQIDSGRTIIWLLRSRDATVRRMAVDIANRVGDSTGELWPKLLQFLRDEDWWVRERVIDALVEMAGLELTRHVVGYLQDKSDVVRRYAVGVLMRLKDPNSLGALVRTAMEDPDWWVREWAIQGLGNLKDARAVPYLINIMTKDAEMRLVCVEAIEFLEATEAAPHVAGLLQMDEDQDVMLAVLRCLTKLNDYQTAGHVAQLQNHEDIRIREAARELLVKWNVNPAHFSGESAIGQKLGMLDQLLYATVRAEADDLLLAAGRKAFIKRRGNISPLSDYLFSEQELRDLLFPHLSAGQQDQLKLLRDVDFSYEVKSQNLRFRANVFQQTTGLSAVFRTIRDVIPDIATLGLPDVVRNFGDMKNGLVLVGGPTGAGKSTTLAAIIDYINRSDARHIITLEDPIEVVHHPKKSLVVQREIGTHSKSYASALRATLREDPDVILVGEMRDLETISFAVSAAETGHLVFGTVHTVSADTSIDRLINTFPSGQQPQVRSMLAGSLRAVVCQHLLQRMDGKGRVLAVEVMLNSDAIASLIRKGKSFQIPSVIATSRELGMQSMDLELARLYKAGIVSPDECYMKAVNKTEFEALFRGEEPDLEGQIASSGADQPPVQQVSTG